MITALIAHGPNSVIIPCMFWANRDIARQQSIDILGPPTEENIQRLYWSVYDEKYNDHDEDKYFYIISAELDSQYPERPSDRNEMEAWDEWRSKRDAWNELCHDNMDTMFKVGSKKIFTQYYGGCGQVGSFELRDLQEGVPQIKFNLD